MSCSRPGQPLKGFEGEFSKKLEISPILMGKSVLLSFFLKEKKWIELWAVVVGKYGILIKNQFDSRYQLKPTHRRSEGSLGSNKAKTPSWKDTKNCIKWNWWNNEYLISKNMTCGLHCRPPFIREEREAMRQSTFRHWERIKSLFFFENHNSIHSYIGLVGRRYGDNKYSTAPLKEFLLDFLMV